MSKIVMYPIEKLKPLVDNPRILDEFKYQTLRESLLGFPKMFLEVRSCVIDKEFNILGGNMRYQVWKDLGNNTCPAKFEHELTDSERKDFNLLDNISFGEFDNELIKQHYTRDFYHELLGKPMVDYSVLDYEDLEDKFDEMQGGVKKAIQIVFNEDNFDTAKALEKQCREQHIYIGGEFLNTLRDERDKLNKSRTHS